MFRLPALLVPALLFAQDPAVLLNQSQADLAAGRYELAQSKCLRAAALFRAAHDGSNEARALTRAGLAQLYSGDHAAALGRFNQAIEISRRIGDTPGEITRLNDAGTALYYLGRYADAMSAYRQAEARVNSSPGQPWTASRRQLTLANVAILYQTVGQYERALELYSALLESAGALPPRELAQFLMNVGTLRRRLGDPRKALETYREAQRIYAKTAHRDGEIAVLNNIGIVQAMDLKDYGSAVKNFTTALEMARRSNNRPLAVHAQLYRGEAMYRAGRLEESARDFEDASQQAQALDEREECWKALFGMARVASAAGRTSEADGLLRKAAGVIETLRAGLGRSTLRSEFLAEKRDVYDALIEHSGNPDEAFRWMEQSRARDLRDRLGAPAPPALDAFAARLPPDQVVLEYWIGASSAAVVWMSSAGTGMKRWTLGAADRASLANLPAILADGRLADWRAAAAIVSKMLLSGIPPLNDGRIGNVTVVADGVLWRIPFEALPAAGGALMAERFTVSYSPSASLLALWSGRKTRIVWPWQTGFKAAADPAPGAGDGGLPESRDWPRLPEAAREAASIANVLGARSQIETGAAARRSVLAGHPEAPLVHIASHAFADSQDPERSYILFAPSQAGQRFDHLYLKEAYELPLRNVELATISACETDVGKFVPGEGVQSFTPAFLAAGAKSVVTSLWKVNDNATAELMLRFYSHLGSGMGKAEALRQAKLDFLRSPPASHPANWAAFVISGDARSRIPYLVPWTYLAAPAAIAILGIAALRIRAKKA